MVAWDLRSIAYGNVVGDGNFVVYFILVAGIGANGYSLCSLLVVVERDSR